MSILAGSVAFSIATLLSRIFGLARDMSLAFVYGASSLLDAYLISIIFPFFLRKIFGEGALGSSFIPFYKTSEDKDGFASSVINFFLLVTILIVIFVELFPWIVPKVFSMGYSGVHQKNIESLVRVTVLFVPEIFLWAVFYSILNSHNKFFLPAVSPLVMNIGVILGTLFGRTPFWSAVGFVLGGFFATLLLALKASKYFKFRFKLLPSKTFIIAFLKASASMAANQFNLLVDTNVASFLGMGAISYLQLASRLYMLPLGLFGVAVSTVALSVMSGSENKRKHMKEAYESVLLFVLPSFVGLWLLADGIIGLVFGFGRFDQQAVAKTAEVLRMYSLGIIPYSFFRISLRFHHSSKQMNIPLFATLLVSGSNAVLDIVLAKFMGVSGVALATSIAGFIGFVFFLIRREVFLDLKESTKIVLASAAMGAFIGLFKDVPGKLWALALILLSSAVYALVLALLDSKKLKELAMIIRR